MKDKFQGKAEELKGKLTGDKSEEMKGEGRQKVGGLKQDAREVEDKLSGRDADRDIDR
jgi:uncharacterized protein YjbJ (UPF0337 family)